MSTTELYPRQERAVHGLLSRGWEVIGRGPLVGSSRYYALRKDGEHVVVYHDGTVTEPSDREPVTHEPVRHPDLDRIVQAERDRLLDQWGSATTEERAGDGYTLVFGLADDCQMGMTKVIHRTGHVARLAESESD